MARRSVTDLVEPDLPITPMLDMSFQLLSFFIMTFHPTPTEGQIPVSLPAMPGGEEKAPSVDIIEKPTHYIVQVQSTDQGTIANITLHEENAPGERDLGADVKVMLKELKAIVATEARRRETVTPRITIEIGDKLAQASVVQIYDATIQAGFTNIATVPIDKTKR